MRHAPQTMIDREPRPADAGSMPPHKPAAQS